VHVASAFIGSGKGFDHFGSYVSNIFLHSVSACFQNLRSCESHCSKMLYPMGRNLFMCKLVGGYLFTWNLVAAC
jgi:hypothetical protein